MFFFVICWVPFQAWSPGYLLGGSWSQKHPKMGSKWVVQLKFSVRIFIDLIVMTFYEYTFLKLKIYDIRCEFDVHACVAVSSRPTRSQSNMLLKITNVYHCCFRSVGSVTEAVRNMVFVAQARGENLRWIPPRFRLNDSLPMIPLPMIPP